MAPEHAASATTSTASVGVEPLLCAGRAGCSLIGKVLSAGVASDGSDLSVASASLAPVEGSVTPYEHWLLSVGATGPRVVKLLVAGVTRPGESAPTLTVTGPGTARYQRYPDTVDIGLDPPRILRTEYHWHEDIENAYRASYWSYPDFAGADCVTESPVAPCTSEPSLKLPYVLLEPAFRKGGWRTTSLGSCAMTVDGSPGHGIATPPAPPTATLRAVAAGSEVFVQVTDDAFVANGAERDALHFMFGSVEAPGYSFDVYPDGRTTARSFTRVETAVVDANTRRFRIDFGHSLGGRLLVSYLDTDDGRTVRQRLDSSPNDSPWLFSRLEDLERSCEVRDGALVPTPLPSKPADQPLYGIR